MDAHYETLAAFYQSKLKGDEAQQTVSKERRIRTNIEKKLLHVVDEVGTVDFEHDGQQYRARTIPEKLALLAPDVRNAYLEAGFTAEQIGKIDEIRSRKRIVYKLHVEQHSKRKLTEEQIEA
jgi:hypothetical protein